VLIRRKTKLANETKTKTKVKVIRNTRTLFMRIIESFELTSKVCLFFGGGLS